MTIAAEAPARAPITPRAAGTSHPTLSSAPASIKPESPRVLARLPDVSSRTPATDNRPATKSAVQSKPALVVPRRIKIRVPAWLSHRVALVAVAAVALAVLIASTRNRDGHARRLDSPPAWNGQFGQPATGAAEPAAETYTAAPPPVVKEDVSARWNFRDEQPPALQADRRNGAAAYDYREPAPSAPTDVRTTEAPPEMPIRFPTAGPRRPLAPVGAPRMEYNQFAPQGDGLRHAERGQYDEPRVSRRYEETPRARFDGTIRTPPFPSHVTPHDDARSVFH
jgi:hypothetical protein